MCNIVHNFFISNQYVSKKNYYMHTSGDKNNNYRSKSILIFSHKKFCKIYG